MKPEYNIYELKPRSNPYTSQTEKEISICLDCHTIQYFQKLAMEKGVSIHSLIRLYLQDFARNQREPEFLQKDVP